MRGGQKDGDSQCSFTYPPTPSLDSQSRSCGHLLAVGRLGSVCTRERGPVCGAPWGEPLTIGRSRGALREGLEFTGGGSGGRRWPGVLPPPHLFPSGVENQDFCCRTKHVVGLSRGAASTRVCHGALRHLGENLQTRKRTVCLPVLWTCVVAMNSVGVTLLCWV